MPSDDDESTRLFRVPPKKSRASGSSPSAVDVGVPGEDDGDPPVPDSSRTQVDAFDEPPLSQTQDNVVPLTWDDQTTSDKLGAQARAVLMGGPSSSTGISVGDLRVAIEVGGEEEPLSMEPRTAIVPADVIAELLHAHDARPPMDSVPGENATLIPTMRGALGYRQVIERSAADERRGEPGAPPTKPPVRRVPPPPRPPRLKKVVRPAMPRTRTASVPPPAMVPRPPSEPPQAEPSQVTQGDSAPEASMAPLTPLQAPDPLDLADSSMLTQSVPAAELPVTSPRPDLEPLREAPAPDKETATSLADLADIEELGDYEDDVTRTSAKPFKATPRAAVLELVPEDDGEHTEIGKPIRMGVAPAAYKPPAPDPTALREAFEVDADEEEMALIKASSWEPLVELHLARMQTAPTGSVRARLLLKIASVFEARLGDDAQAFDALVEAFDTWPANEEVAAAIERVAPKLDAWNTILERVVNRMAGATPDLRATLTARLAKWYDVGAKRPDLADEQTRELQMLDPGHPLVCLRAAREARARGDSRNERDQLERALDRTQRRDERVLIYMAMARVRGNTADVVQRHLEAAYRLAPQSFEVLAFMEQLAGAFERFGVVEWTLEEQVKRARKTEDKVAALLRHAELLEKRYVRRDAAAQKFEHVIRLVPNHAVAFAGLERCYHAQRMWPELARTFERRAEHAETPRARLELLRRAAEVLDLKVSDPQGAALVLKQGLAADSRDAKLLADLARLSEKARNFLDVVTYKSALADITPNKRMASQMYVQIGDILAQPDNDPMGARLAYEKAVSVDRTNTHAWEAVERMARESEDQQRLVQCLEERAKYTDSPRLRAQVLAELGSLRQRLGDGTGARAAFEGAQQADPGNERAKLEVLEAYLAEEKWAQAAPLAEQLVAATSRSKEIQFARLRLATRAFSGKGDVDKALGFAIQACEIDTSSLEAWTDLLDLANRGANKGSFLERMRPLFEHMRDAPLPLEADMLCKLGNVELAMGMAERALITFSRAMELDSDSPAALTGMVGACLAKEDWAGACDCKVALARNAVSLDEKFKQLCEAGEIWAHRANDYGEANRVWEEALAINPRDHWLLHALMWLYGEMEDWEKLDHILLKIADIQESPERRAKSLFARAQVIDEKVGDDLRAAHAYEEVLEVDPARLDAFEQVVRLLTSRKDWWELERAYRVMIGRVQSGSDGGLKAALFQQLGIIYRDRIGDAAQALEAFSAAARMRPEDGELRRIVTELLVVTDHLDQAVAQIREKIEHEPLDAGLFSELYELFLRQQAFDRAWCALDVLSTLAQLTPDQAQFHTDYPPFPLGEIPGQITDEAWRSHLLHRELDPVLTRVFSWTLPAVARARHKLLPPHEASLLVGRPFTGSHTPMAQKIRTTFRNASEVLGIPSPDLLAAPPSTTGQPLAPALSPFGAIYVNGPLVEARADLLTYLIGKRLAEQRPELAARAFYPTVSEMTSLLAVAVRVANGTAGRDPGFLPFDTVLLQTMTWEEQGALRQLVTGALAEGKLLDVRRWSQLADVSSTRAGLLLAGDMATARRAIQKEPQTSSDLVPREKIAALNLFAISDQHADLRGAIGVAVASEQ